VTVQTASGFGSMLVCITLGALRWPIAELLPVLIPVMLVQSLWVVMRHARSIDVSLLLQRVVPLMGLGMLGAMVVAGRDVSSLRPLLGAIILMLASRELLRRTPAPPLKRWQSRLGVFLAGVLHGLFGTGGAVLVWSIARESVTKTVLRSTLTAVWLILNAGMFAVFWMRGQATSQTLVRSAWVLPAVGIGLLAGEWLHRHISEERFRHAVWAVLCVAAVPLIASF